MDADGGRRLALDPRRFLRGRLFRETHQLVEIQARSDSTKTTDH